MRCMRSNTPLILTFSALLLIHLLFFTFTLIRPPDPLSDSTEYLNASGNIYTRGTLYCGELSEPIREELFTRRPPLYPVLLGIALLTGSTIPVLLLQTLFSMLSLLLVFKIFGPGTGNRGNPFYPLFFLFLLFTPAQFIYSNRIMAEIPFQLILVLMAWSVHRHFNPGTGEHPPLSQARYVWLFYLLLSMGMAMKPVLFPFLIPVALFSIFAFLRTKKTAWFTGLLIPLIWISAYSIYNKHRSGSIQYSSIQTANLVNYNLRYFVLSEEGAEKAAETVDRLYEHCGSAQVYAEKNRCLTAGVREIISEKPIRYALFHLRGSVRYFLDPGRFDLVTFFGLSPPDATGILKVLHEDGLRGIFRFLKNQGWGWIALLGSIALFKLFKGAGLLLFLFRGRNELPFKIFLVLLIGYLALVTGPLGASRFMLPVELLVIGAALKGWMMWLKRTGSPPTAQVSCKAPSDPGRV